jgi:hypothetical protein
MAPTRSTLSVSRRRLVDICSRIGFGRIERLLVRSGEPQFDAATLIVTERKLGAEATPTDRSADFTLKPTVVDLMRVLDLVGNGSIRCLEVRHGLPFRVEIEGELAA